MLSKSQVVKARESIEQLYDHLCTVSVKEEVTCDDGSTDFTDIVIISNQKCRMSYVKIGSVDKADMSYHVSQGIKLFLAPEIDVPAGSKITVIHDGHADTYIMSGSPAVYPTHQEIMLEKEQSYA